MKAMSKLLSSLLLAVVMSLILLTSAFAESTWVKKNSLPEVITYTGVITVDGKLYKIGGVNQSKVTNAIHQYDPTNDTWIAKASMLTPRHSFGITEVNGKVYVFGGFNGGTILDTVEEYDPATDQWTPKASMPTARGYLQAGVVNGKIYAVGGVTNNNQTLTVVEEYDPLTNKWSIKDSLITQRATFSMGVVQNKIYVIGGYNKQSYNIQKVEEYNPATNKWVEKADVSFSRTSELGHTTYNNNIYILGDALRVYEPSTDTWSTMEGITPNRYNTGLGILNGKMYAIGGDSTNVVEEFSLPAIQVEFPTNLTATSGNAQNTLNWKAVTGATSYNIKRSTAAGGPYTTVASNVTATTYTDNNVTNGTKYYYVVTAVNASGESGNSNEASTTPTAPVTTSPTTSTGNRALLVITLVSGLEKEYDLPMTDVNSFTAWYAARAAGSGPEVYTINKSFNKASFLSRKDNIAFDKIELYEVNEYTAAP